MLRKLSGMGQSVGMQGHFYEVGYSEESYFVSQGTVKSQPFLWNVQGLNTLSLLS